jgi:ATP-binding cassette, subfamily B, bacterial
VNVSNKTVSYPTTIQTTKRASDLKLWQRLWQQSRPCWPHLSGILLLSLISTPIALLFPLPLKIAVDNAISKRPLPPFVTHLLPHVGPTALAVACAVALLLGLNVVMHVQALAGWWIQTYTGEKLVWDLRAQLLQHAQRLSLSLDRRTGSMDATYVIQHDSPAIQNVMIQGLVPLVTALLTLVGMLAVLVRIDWRLAVIALAVIPELFLLTRSCSRRVRSGSYKIKELDSSAMSVVQEVLSSLVVVKAFGQEDREYARFVRRSSSRMQGQVRLAIIQGKYNLAIGFTFAVGTAAALLMGVHEVTAGLITVGDLLLVMAYLAQMYEPLRLISTRITDLQSWLASVDRAFGLLDEVPDITERKGALAITRARGDIVFRNVSFHYDGGTRGVHNIDFTVPAGARVGIVGTTGAGKTTLLNLLTRFYDVTDGQVLVDGVDVRDYKIAELRRQFAIVLQEPVLFSASIAENIAYGRASATDEEIVAAAISAGAHDFITRLPRGYETQVGERGACLSGGERQRISLARAFVRDSPILILDEPTSSVDLRTESAILRATEKLMQGRTSFMIAHRLTTLKACDMILVLEQGRLVDIRGQKTADFHHEEIPELLRAAFAAPAGGGEA